MVAVVDPRIGLLDLAAIAFPHDARANAPTGASVRDDGEYASCVFHDSR